MISKTERLRRTFDNSNGYMGPKLAILLKGTLLVFFLAFTALIQTRIVVFSNSLVSLLMAVFLIWGVPGFLITNALLRQEAIPLVDRLTLSFVVGIEAFVLLSTVPVYAHSTMYVLDWFFLAGDSVLVISYLIYYMRRYKSAQWDSFHQVAFPDRSWLDPEVIALVIIFVAVASFFMYTFAVNLHPWLIGGDRWTYLTAIRVYLDSGKLQLFSGLYSIIGDGRMSNHVWTAVLAFVCQFANVDLVEMYNVYLPVVLGLTSILCFYVFHRALFKEQKLVLFCTVVYVLYLCSTMTMDSNGVATRGGHRLMTGAIEDKGITLFVFLPIAMTFALWFLERNQKRYLFLFALSVGASAVTHPLAYFFISMFIGLFAVARVLDSFFTQPVIQCMTLPQKLLSKWQGCRTTVVRFVALTAITTIFIVFPASKMLDVIQTNPAFVDPSKDPYNIEQLSRVLLNRHVVLMGLGSYRAAISLVDQPIFILAIILIPFLLFYARHDEAAQFLLVSFVGPLVMVFIPWTASLLAKVIGSYQLYRVNWVVPAAQVVGYVIYTGLSNLWRKLRLSRNSFRQQLGSSLSTVLVLLLITVWLSPQITKGVKYRIQEYEKWKMDPTLARNLQDLGADLRRELTSPSTVVAPYRLLRHLPALTMNVSDSIFAQPTLEKDSVIDSIARLYKKRVIDTADIAFLKKYNVHYIICDSQCAFEFQPQLQKLMFHPVYSNESYRLYEVAPLNNLHTIAGNLALQQQAWEEAIHEYQMALREYPDESAAYLGLGSVYYNQGEWDKAVENYRQAVTLSSNPTKTLQYIDLGIGQSYLAKYLVSGDAYRSAGSVLNSGMVAYDFLANLPSSGTGLDPQRASFVIDGRPETVLLQHPLSQIPFHVTIPVFSRLEFDIALAPGVWRSGRGDGVTFAIKLDTEANTYSLFSEYIDPKSIQLHRQWNHRSVDLQYWASQIVTITFATSPGPNGDDRYDWAGWGEPRIVQPVAYSFLDHFPQAKQVNMELGQTLTKTQTINYDTRPILFQHPSSRVAYSLTLPLQSTLRFGIGMAPEVWSPDKGDGVEYRVLVQPADGAAEIVFSRYIDPKNNADDRRWFDEQVDLSPFGGQAVKVIFEALPGPAGNANFDWGGWSWPVLIDETLPDGTRVGLTNPPLSIP